MADGKPGNGEQTRAERLLGAQKEALQRAIGGAPIEEVLNALVEMGAEQLGGKAAIFILDEDGKSLSFGAAAGMSEAYIEGIDKLGFGPHLPFFGTLAYDGERVIAADIEQNPLWAPFASLAPEYGLRACWSTPIRAFGGKVLGTFAVYHEEPCEPEPGDLDAMDLLAHTAAILIERHKAEDRQQAGEQLLSTILEYLPVAVGVLRPNGRFERANRLMRRFLGDVAASFDEQVAAKWRATGADGKPLERHDYPVARALRGETVTGIKFRYCRDDGSEIWTRVSAVPVRDAAGEITAALCVLVDVDQEERDRQTLATSEARYRHILDSAKEYAIITLDSGGRITSWNSGAQRLLGYEASEIVGLSGEVFFTSEDRAAGEPEREMRAAREKARAANERWHMRKDGSRFWGSGVMLPLQGPDGDGYLKIFRDQTEERQAAERQGLLLEELNHRVKNTLAAIQSIVAQGLRNVPVGEVARDAIEARVFALSSSHDLLARESWEGAGLMDVVRQAVDPYAAAPGEPARIVIDSPDVRLPPKAAVALGMAFHELATNAAKYGALSSGEGRVDVTWSITPAPEGKRLRIGWRESGGPPVRPPRRKGFGSRLLERGLARELDGVVSLEFLPEGLTCRIDIPVPDMRRGDV